MLMLQQTLNTLHTEHINISFSYIINSSAQLRPVVFWKQKGTDTHV